MGHLLSEAFPWLWAVAPSPAFFSFVVLTTAGCTSLLCLSLTLSVQSPPAGCELQILSVLVTAVTWDLDRCLAQNVCSELLGGRKKEVLLCCTHSPPGTQSVHAGQAE